MDSLIETDGEGFEFDNIHREWDQPSEACYRKDGRVIIVRHKSEDNCYKASLFNEISGKFVSLWTEAYNPNKPMSMDEAAHRIFKLLGPKNV